MSYNGWANYETWNVALHVGENPIYDGAVEFMQSNPDSKTHYKDFIESCGLDTQKTGDGVYYTDLGLDYPRLDEMMRELIV